MNTGSFDNPVLVGFCGIAMSFAVSDSLHHLQDLSLALLSRCSSLLLEVNRDLYPTDDNGLSDGQD